MNNNILENSLSLTVVFWNMILSNEILNLVLKSCFQNKISMQNLKF